MELKLMTKNSQTLVTNLDLPYQICQRFVKKKIARWSGRSIFLEACKQAKVFTFDSTQDPSSSEVAPSHENGNQPDNPEEKDPRPVLIPDFVRTLRNVHADFFICAGRFIFRFGHD